MTISDTDNAISTTALTKTFRRGTAVDAVSLQVRRGEVYGFVGLNGAGKTTFMRMLVGLARPSSGSFSVLGSATLSNDVLRRVGTMIEGPTFYPGMTGRQNLVLIAKYAGLARTAVDTALEAVELGDRGDDVFRTYSLGMKQRLGLAAALLGEPELLILDEPTKGFDPVNRRLLMDVIEAHRAGGATVVIITHQMEEVERLCDRVLLLKDGRAEAYGTVPEVQDAYGGRTIRLGFAGVLPEGPFRVIRHETNYAELELDASADPQAVLRLLLDAGVVVRSFDASRLSMDEVFLRVYGHSSDKEL